MSTALVSLNASAALAALPNTGNLMQLASQDPAAALILTEQYHQTQIDKITSASNGALKQAVAVNDEQAKLIQQLQKRVVDLESAKDVSETTHQAEIKSLQDRVTAGETALTAKDQQLAATTQALVSARTTELNAAKAAAAQVARDEMIRKVNRMQGK